MKFFTFVKKELRETLFPGVILFFIAALVVFYIVANNSRDDLFGYHQPFHEHPIPEDLFAALMIFNAGAAVAIAMIQFWLPWITKTWTFQLQRASKRTSIFWAKFTAGILCVVIPSLLLWTAAFSYIRYTFPIPLRWDIWIEGLLPLGWGINFYLATALSSLLTARLYTTRFFPLPIALLALLGALGTLSFLSVVIGPIIVSMLFICQMIDEIQTREF